MLPTLRHLPGIIPSKLITEWRHFATLFLKSKVMTINILLRTKLPTQSTLVGLSFRFRSCNTSLYNTVFFGHSLSLFWMVTYVGKANSLKLRRQRAPPLVIHHLAPLQPSTTYNCTKCYHSSRSISTKSISFHVLPKNPSVKP